MKTHLNYCDIKHNPERTTKLDHYAHKYNFKNNTPKEFKLNNPNISLTVVDENNNAIYDSISNSYTKVKIVKINNNRYAGIKPIKNKYIKLKELLQSFTHKELKAYIMNKIIH